MTVEKEGRAVQRKAKVVPSLACIIHTATYAMQQMQLFLEALVQDHVRRPQLETWWHGIYATHHVAFQRFAKALSEDVQPHIT